MYFAYCDSPSLEEYPITEAVTLWAKKKNSLSKTGDCGHNFSNNSVHVIMM